MPTCTYVLPVVVSHYLIKSCFYSLYLKIDLNIIKFVHFLCALPPEEIACYMRFLFFSIASAAFFVWFTLDSGEINNGILAPKQ